LEEVITKGHREASEGFRKLTDELAKAQGLLEVQSKKDSNG